MKKTFLVLAVLCLSAFSSFALTNGDFEAGDLSGRITFFARGYDSPHAVAGTFGYAGSRFVVRADESKQFDIGPVDVMKSKCVYQQDEGEKI